MPIEMTTSYTYQVKCSWCGVTSVTRALRAEAFVGALENGWEFTRGQSGEEVSLCHNCANTQPIRKKKAG